MTEFIPEQMSWLYTGSERNTGGVLLSVHSICVFSSTGFDVNFISFIIGFAVYITVCVLQYELRNVMQTFFFSLCSHLIIMFSFMLLLISCSAILCGCTVFVCFFPPDNSHNSLCTVICPLPFLSRVNTGELKEEFCRGHYLIIVHFHHGRYTHF